MARTASSSWKPSTYVGGSAPRASVVVPRLGLGLGPRLLDDPKSHASQPPPSLSFACGAGASDWAFLRFLGGIDLCERANTV